MCKWRRNKSNTRRWQKNHLIQKFGGMCMICGLPFAKKKDITLDHIIPISKGGFDLLDNYQLAHYQCNQLKADMTPEEFKIFQQGGELVE